MSLQESKFQDASASTSPSSTPRSLVPSVLERNLGHRGQVAFAATTSALLASATIAPLMAVIDLSIIRAQFEKHSFVSAVQRTTKDLLSGRLHWNPALTVMKGVYASTYLTANWTKALCDEYNVDYKVPTAVATSTVNVAAIAYKDRAYASLTSGRAAVFPLSSYGLFALRDGLTVVSSFVLKNNVRDQLQDKHGLSHRHADLAASFAVPMAAQLLSTPVHILSLDLYSRPSAPARARLALIAEGYRSVVCGRVMRILPAFGLGGFLNDVVKEGLTGTEEHEK